MKYNNLLRFEKKKTDEIIIRFKKSHFYKFYILLILFFLYLFQDIFKTFNSFLNSKKNIKVCLCTIGKKENLYIKEYVNYYIELGYNQIFLYDNNDLNDEKFEDVLQEEIKKKYVTIIDVRGKIGYHCDAYRECYEKNSKTYDWLSFFDLDEFLEVRPQSKNIQEFVGNKMFKNCDNIKINFLFYSDNELTSYDKRPVQERFKTALYGHGHNAIIKTMVKGGLKINYWSIKCTPHTSFLNCTTCTSFGKVVPPGTWYVFPINYTYAALKHYYSKSAEEYAIKSARGEASSFAPWDINRKRRKVDNYFVYNIRNKNKEELLKKYFNLTE